MVMVMFCELNTACGSSSRNDSVTLKSSWISGVSSLMTGMAMQDGIPRVELISWLRVVLV